MEKMKRSCSMYSLQDEYASGRMDLEDIFKFVTEQGCGIEFISDQMMHHTPHPTEDSLKKWDELVEKYNPPLVANDIFVNSKLYRNRVFTTQEGVEALIEEIKLTHRLGFKVARLVSCTPPRYIEPALKYAEKYDVILSQEVHAGNGFDCQDTITFIEQMKHFKSPYLGLTIDTGIFCKRIPRVFWRYFRKQGVNEELIDRLNEITATGTDVRSYYMKYGNKDGEYLPKEIKELCHNSVDEACASLADGYEWTDLSRLDELFPYITHFHGKFFEMTEEGKEYSIDFEELFRYINQKGYGYYVSSEYEGNRWTPIEEEVQEKKQVIAHQRMMKNIIDTL